jgi:hypothetical protein
MEVPSEPGQKSDASAVLKEYLLAEHQYLREAFWRNEESGERRLQFFIGLVTAVFGGLGLLATTDKGWFRGCPDRIYAAAAGGLVFLLLVGWMTLGRMNKRDRVSDEYKTSLDEIRNCFLRPAGERMSVAAGTAPKGMALWRRFPGARGMARQAGHDH